MVELSYTIQEAADALSVSAKTLARWCSRAGMVPEPDAADRRRRTLTQEQVDYLDQIYRRPHEKVDIHMSQSSNDEQLQKSLNELKADVSSLSSQVAAVQGSLLSLHKWVAAAMETLATQMQQVAELEDRYRAVEQNGAAHQPNGIHERGGNGAKVPAALGDDRAS